MRVLVVDEDILVREVIAELLLGADLRVRQAANRAEALLELRRWRFDVLVCHLSILREEGGQLALESRRRRPRPWVVAMSASGIKAELDEADVSLSKPFTRAQLVGAIRNEPSPPDRLIRPPEPHGPL